MHPKNESRLTFWSVPPFRQQFQTVARTIKLREVRFIVAEVYGLFYLLYGMKLPVVLLILWSAPYSTRPTAVDLAFAVTPYMIAAMFLSGVIFALAAGGIAWFVLGRAIECRRPSRLRFGIWGALALGGPLLPMVAVVPADSRHFVSGVLIVVLLFGAGIAAGWCWFIQRDQSPQAGE